MWQQMYDQAEEGILRKNARLQLEILDSRDLADRLTAAVAEFDGGAAGGRTELARAPRRGLWRGPLVDAAGVPFGYDVSTGRVSVARESPMWRPE